VAVRIKVVSVTRHKRVLKELNACKREILDLRRELRTLQEIQRQALMVGETMARWKSIYILPRGR
jgi:hypothetical protein